MIEEAKENRVTMAASDHTLMGRRVFTGTPNAKLLTGDLPQLCLIQQQALRATRS